MALPIRPETPARSLDKLIAALNEPDAFAYVGEHEDPARIAIATRRKGVSLRVGAAPRAAADALVRADLAAWSGARLALTPAGRARAARLAALPGVDPFFAQHRPVMAVRGLDPEGGKVAMDEAESPLAWLARRKGRDGRALIAPTSLAAGERLRRDLTAAQVMPRVTADWTIPAVDGGGIGLNPSERAIAARQRVDAACDAVGPEMTGLLIDVCGFLKGLETVESERHWPARSAKVVLVIALARLARHYGLDAEARGGPSRGVQHWGAPDYRPHLAPPDLTPLKDG